MKQLSVIKLSVSLALVLGVVATGAALIADEAPAARAGASSVESPMSSTDEPTPAMIAAWKATARASDYVSPLVPL
ncbi:MAG: hypothetical protein C0P74_009260 [Gammaproteobacteria bacterium]|nr:hypothetical protein [Gammaproteobacteria bacterium]